MIRLALFPAFLLTLSVSLSMTLTSCVGVPDGIGFESLGSDGDKNSNSEPDPESGSRQSEAPLPPAPPAPDADTFLEHYTNPEQAKYDPNGVYPMGQRMMFGAYSGSLSRLRSMYAAGFTHAGPHYHGTEGNPNWEWAEDHGMKNFFRLRLEGSSSSWTVALEKMRTEEGRTYLRTRVKRLIDSVLSDEKLNSNIMGWYGSPEEPITRSGRPIAEQRAYLRFIHDQVKKNDSLKRPYVVSERGDSSKGNMLGNQPFQDMVMKQNYLIRGNAYNGGNAMERMQAWRWGRDVVEVAEETDKASPSYTGRPRAAISTLSMYIDPEDGSLQTEEILTEFIHHDFYAQLAAGVDGFNIYSWSAARAPKTRGLQSNIYLDLVKQFTGHGLGKVFLWGDNRSDVQLSVVSGPETVKWKKYRTFYTEKSVHWKNIQYGNHRYILIVNSATKEVGLKLTGFPDGMEILDIAPGVTYTINGGSISPVLGPREYRMYKVSATEE